MRSWAPVDIGHADTLVPTPPGRLAVADILGGCVPVAEIPEALAAASADPRGMVVAFEIETINRLDGVAR
jgi:hypothetical protein